MEQDKLIGVLWTEICDLIQALEDATARDDRRILAMRDDGSVFNKYSMTAAPGLHLLAVTGKKRSGKDTVANYLQAEHGYLKLPSLASAFKDVAAQWFDWDPEYHYEGAGKEEVDPYWGFSPRQFLQTFGTEIMKTELQKYFPEYAKNIGDKIWTIIYLRNLLRTWTSRVGRYVYPKDNAYVSVVLSDLRFQVEYDTVSTILDEVRNLLRMTDVKIDIDFKILNLVSDRTVLLSTGTAGEAQHSSETEIQGLPWDAQIENNGVGTELQLYAQVDEVLPTLFTKSRV